MTQYKLKAYDTRSVCHQLTTGKIYHTINGIEKDISDNEWKYPDYVTVIGDNGKPLSCHASRFEILEETT